jgi:inositol phosphorylceramide mannosyltransferase catalytic subunit
VFGRGTQVPIPRRIIQTGKNVPQQAMIRACISSVRVLNPDFEYLFFDDAQVGEFIQREFPQYISVFNSFPYPIQKYDFFRYLAVFRYGGFYFDMDMLLASGVSHLLDTGCVFPFERLTFSDYLRTGYDMDWEIGNFAFGATPGHPFLRALIENCIRGQSDPQWVRAFMRGTPRLEKETYYVFSATGPGLCSRTLAENPELGGTVTVLFPADVRDVRTWYHFGDLGIHLMDTSWQPRGGWLRGKMAYYAWRWKERMLLKRSLPLGKTRQHPRRPPAQIAVGGARAGDFATARLSKQRADQREASEDRFFTASAGAVRNDG